MKKCTNSQKKFFFVPAGAIFFTAPFSEVLRDVDDTARIRIGMQNVTRHVIVTATRSRLVLVQPWWRQPMVRLTTRKPFVTVVCPDLERLSRHQWLDVTATVEVNIRCAHVRWTRFDFRLALRRCSGHSCVKTLPPPKNESKNSRTDFGRRPMATTL